jgi:gluconate 5-dehydrogenase
VSGLFDLTGRTALVTGATRGLGLAFARALGAAGARVAINGRFADTVAARVEEFEDAVAAPFDVTDEDAIATAIERLGPVDVLVSNAGIGLRRPLEQFSLDEFRSLLDVNLTGAFLVARAVAPGMIERRRGKIITVCSVMSELARETIAPYSATKGGLKMLTRGMCADWARFNIQANAIGPGYFRTDLNEPLWTNPEFDGWLRRRVPAARWGEPDELGGTVVFLASAASDYVNGQILYVDGGMTAVV